MNKYTRNGYKMVQPEIEAVQPKKGSQNLLKILELYENNSVTIITCKHEIFKLVFFWIGLCLYALHLFLVSLSSRT